MLWLLNRMRLSLWIHPASNIWKQLLLQENIFFTNLSCYSIQSCEKLSDKQYGPGNITHRSNSSHSCACSAAIPVTADGLDTWKQAWMEAVVFLVSNIHWENELYFRLHPRFAYLDENLTLSEIFKSICITQEYKSQFLHERNAVHQCGQELVSFNQLDYLHIAQQPAREAAPEALVKGAWNISEDVIPEDVLFIQIFRFIMGFIIAHVVIAALIRSQTNESAPWFTHLFGAWHCQISSSLTSCWMPITPPRFVSTEQSSVPAQYLWEQVLYVQ